MGHLVGVSVEEQLGEASEESFVGLTPHDHNDHHRHRDDNDDDHYHHRRRRYHHSHHQLGFRGQFSSSCNSSPPLPHLNYLSARQYFSHNPSLNLL